MQGRRSQNKSQRPAGLRPTGRWRSGVGWRSTRREPCYGPLGSSSFRPDGIEARTPDPRQKAPEHALRARRARSVRSVARAARRRALHGRSEALSARRSPPGRARAQALGSPLSGAARGRSSAGVDRGAPRGPRAARAPGAPPRRLPLELAGSERHSPSQARCTCNAVPKRGAYPPKVTMPAPVASAVSRSCDRHNPSATCKAPSSHATAARCVLQGAPKPPSLSSRAAREPVSALPAGALPLPDHAGQGKRPWPDVPSAPERPANAMRREASTLAPAAATAGGSLSVDSGKCDRALEYSPLEVLVEVLAQAAAAFEQLGDDYRRARCPSSCSKLEPSCRGFPMLPGSAPGRAGYCAGCVCGVPGCHRFEAFRRTLRRGQGQA